MQFVHWHLEKAWNSQAYSLIGTPYLVIITSNDLYKLHGQDLFWILQWLQF